MSPDYDAFGRPVQPSAPRPAPRRRAAGERAPARRRGEDTSGSVPVVRGLPPVDGGPPAGRPPSGRRRATGNIAAGVSLAFVVLLFVIGSLADTDEDDRTGRSGSSDRRPALTAAAADRAFAALRGAVRPGERVLSASFGGRSASLRVSSPDRPGTRSVSLGPNDEVRSFDSSSTPGGAPGIPLDAVEAAAPGRIVRAVQRGLQPGGTGSVRYLSAYASQDGRLHWSASAQGVDDTERSWSADEDGRAVVRTRDGAPAPRAGEPGPATVPRGLAGRSLLVAGNVRAALRAVRTQPELEGRTAAEIRVGTLNLQPERGLVGVQTASRRRLISVNAAFGVGPSSSTTATDESIALSEVDPAGPERALRAIGRRASTDAAGRVEYVTLTIDGDAAPGDRAGWFITLSGDDEQIWRASGDGRRVGVSGEPLTR